MRGTSQALLAAGAGPSLLQHLRAVEERWTNADPGRSDGGDCPVALAVAGQLTRRRKYQEAQSILQKLIATDSGNAALHFALGYVHQQRQDWDDALDSSQNAQQLMPGLSDVHSRVAYLLYRADDADGAIAEARTALSIDSRNAEAYRFLGLGLFANSQYAAAIHAFHDGVPCPPAQ